MARFPLLCRALEHLVDRCGPVEGRTRLMKLIYLADLEWATRHGHGTAYTEARYFRWNYGPFSREVLEALNWMDGIEVVQLALPHQRGEIHYYQHGSRTRLSHVVLDPAFADLLDRVGAKWSGRPLKELLAHVYGKASFKGSAFGQPLLQPSGGR